MTKFYAGTAVAVMAALLGGSAYWVYSNQSSDPFAACRGGQVAGGAIGGPFTLINQKGETVTDKDVITKPTLVYFGYTFCPDICPLDNARNAEAVDILEEMGLDVTPVFITIDPKRDTPEVMAEYADIMHPKMIALTGSDEQVKVASLAYKSYYKVQDATDEFYLVDHSTFTYLMLPETGFADFFKREVTPDQLAERVACFASAR
mgnify:CR=1 FL=1|jgi:protein SCO1/2